MIIIYNTDADTYQTRTRREEIDYFYSEYPTKLPKCFKRKRAPYYELTRSEYDYYNDNTIYTYTLVR